jgi:FkbH-like protein
MIADFSRSLGHLRDLLIRGDPAFWPELARRARTAAAFEELIALATMRKRGLARGPAPSAEALSVRLALIGAYTTYPLRELVELMLWANGIDAVVWTGEYDNYVSEILDESSPLYAAAPQVVVLMPSVARCRYEGELTDDRSKQEQQVRAHVDRLLGLCESCRDRSKAELILCNYPLPSDFDLGAFRTRTLASDWSFRKAVNLELGLRAPPFVHVCDVEFLSARRGALACRDPRMWFESKQAGSPGLLVEVANELTHLAKSLRSSAKKVLALDLDNTLWGGVIGDDGLDGIELGTTSPRGEAFRAFQSYVASLKKRGVLLAVCSKNDHARAAEVFEKHPEMVLRMNDFAAFAANWNAKSDNLHAIAAELNLGLDSFVFVDDNPAEVEIVRQFAPAVETILLGPDPAYYVSQLADCRWFEPRSVTFEDLGRTDLYRAEGERRALLASVTDMDRYLESLEMRATVKPFRRSDVTRITQLVNKSNQFNLTTRRRTEGEIAAMISEGPTRGFTIRLSDRFGEHGLIAVVICKLAGATMEIDTWVMSCRVLKRQVEEETVNAIMELAASLGAERVRGHYLPTAKNSMVRDLFPRMGFVPSGELPGHLTFEIDPRSYRRKSTRIRTQVNNDDG